MSFDIPTDKIRRHGAHIPPDALAQAKGPLPSAGYSASFYEVIDNGRIDMSHPFVNTLRPQDVSAVTALYERVVADKGKEYAIKVLSRYYAETIKRNQIQWGSLDFYLKLADDLKKSPNDIIMNIGVWIEERIDQYVRANKEHCPDEYKLVCQATDKSESDYKKAWYHHKTGGPTRLLSKLWCKTVDQIAPSGAAGIARKYKTGHIELRKIDGSLPGFTVEEIFVDGTKTAVLITGDPKAKAVVGMSVVVGGGATVEKIEKEVPRLQAQFPGSFQHGAKLPEELMISGGEVARQLPPDATRHHGYVIVFPDGRMTIVDKRAIKLSEITGKDEDGGIVLNLGDGGDVSDLVRFKEEMKKARASSAPVMLMAHNGKIDWAKENGNDERRLLAIYGDGSFSIISTICGDRKECMPGGGEKIGINDALMLLTRIGEKRGGLVSAVNLDTGHYDYAAYYTYAGGTRKRNIIGHPDNTTQVCRIYFFVKER